MFFVYSEISEELPVHDYFDTHEEALIFSKSLKRDSTIYQAVTKVTITHEIEDLEL